MEMKFAPLFFLPWALFLAALAKRVMRYNPAWTSPAPLDVLIFITVCLSVFAFLHRLAEILLVLSIRRVCSELGLEEGHEQGDGEGKDECHGDDEEEEKEEESQEEVGSMLAEIITLVQHAALMPTALWIIGGLFGEALENNPILFVLALAGAWFALMAVLRISEQTFPHDSQLVRISIAGALIVALPWYLGAWQGLLGWSEGKWMESMAI